MGVSWSEWLARFDEDCTAIGIRADEIVNDPNSGHCLCDGSLYLLDKLDVHPMFRGQRIGMHLCRYVLHVMPKTDSDMIFLLAEPIDSKYEDGNKNRITDINRLAEYYIAAGFRFVRSSRTSRFCWKQAAAIFRSDPIWHILPQKQCRRLKFIRTIKPPQIPSRRNRQSKLPVFHFGLSDSKIC